jgi:hypothetical protein
MSFDHNRVCIYDAVFRAMRNTQLMDVESSLKYANYYTPWKKFRRGKYWIGFPVNDNNINLPFWPPSPKFGQDFNVKIVENIIHCLQQNLNIASYLVIFLGNSSVPSYDSRDRTLLLHY